MQSLIQLTKLDWIIYFNIPKSQNELRIFSFLFCNFIVNWFLTNKFVVLKLLVSMLLRCSKLGRQCLTFFIGVYVNTESFCTESDIRFLMLLRKLQFVGNPLRSYHFCHRCFNVCFKFQSITINCDHFASLQLKSGHLWENSCTNHI